MPKYEPEPCLQPSKVTFVARLRPGQLPNQAARQLPDLSTIVRVEPSPQDANFTNHRARINRSIVAVVDDLPSEAAQSLSGGL
jgi:hypothetical protein